MSPPPPYDEAVSVSAALASPSVHNILHLVLPYVRFSDLLSCGRVCRFWYRPCIALLWSDPSTQLRKHTSPIPVAIRCIDMILAPSAKLALVTLDWTGLISLVKEYNNQSFKIRDDLNLNTVASLYQHAPNIQFEILDGIEGLCDPDLFEESKRSSANSPQWLLLFSAAKCYGLNCPSLMLCSKTQSLMFLDMSHTKPDELLYRRFSQLYLPNLRILKLKGLRLTDKMLKIMLEEHTKLWSLDLRDNLFTDLVMESFVHLLERRVNRPYRSLDREQALDLYEHPPSYQRDEGDELRNTQLPSVRPDSKVEFMKYFKQNGQKNGWGQFILDRQDPLLKETGLTHLYLSGNKLTSGGIQTIMNHTDQLQVLDVGSVRYTEHTNALPAAIMTSYSLIDIRPYISRSIASHLTELRVHHSLVTLAPTLYYPNKENQDFYKLGLLELSEVVAKKLWMTSFFDPFTIVSNFSIKTLTLTAIPRKSYGQIIEDLKALLQRYRIQEKVLMKAREDLGSHRRASPLLPGLRTLRFEFVAPVTDTVETKSISGDTDAANFNEASSNDFSFFTDTSTTTPSSRHRVKHRRERSDFSFFPESQATSSLSSGQTSGTNSPPELSLEKPSSIFISLSRFISSSRNKAGGNRNFPPPAPLIASYKQAVQDLAATLVSLITVPNSPSPLLFSTSFAPYINTEPNSVYPGPASPPITSTSGLLASTQVAANYTFESSPAYPGPALESPPLPAAHLAASRFLFDANDVHAAGSASLAGASSEGSQKNGKSKAKEAISELYDVIEEIKKFRRECPADQKWTGKLELVYGAGSS